jgi:hypothetical protein
VAGGGSVVKPMELGAAEQTQACRTLLALVVHTALRDACLEPLREKNKRGVRLRIEAFTAMRFLFDESVSGLNEYAMWLDFDAGQFRLRLKNIMADLRAGTRGGFTDMDRLNFNRNYKLYLLAPGVSEHDIRKQEEEND